MGYASGITWTSVLTFGNLLLSSAIVITAFSLLAYVLTRNMRSPVALAFSVLLACVLIVFSGDILIPRVESYEAAARWLRVQWIGIALVPAGYLHFSDALLRTTRQFSGPRRRIIAGAYLVGGLLVYLALFTDTLVKNGAFQPPLSHLRPGPLFPVFVAYFVLTAAYGAYNVYQARKRCLTEVSRRRMTYLTISFAAPGLGVFPYLIGSSFAPAPPSAPILLVSMIANVAVGAMLVVMAYSVAYYGVLAPDRVIKHDLVHYLLRGPVVGTLVIVAMLVIPRVELILGLPRDTALVFVVVGVLVLGQLAVNSAKPWIDRLLYSEDREEISWIQALDRRLLTSSDLRRFLDTLLTGLCELLLVDTGFVMVQTGGGLSIETAVGERTDAERFARSDDARTAWQAYAERLTDAATAKPPRPEAGRFEARGDFWLCPLVSNDGGTLLAVLGVRARNQEIDLDPGEQSEANMFLAQATAAIADRYVQEGVFVTLQRILPELERIQEWQSSLLYAHPETSEAADTDERQVVSTSTPGAWQGWVKDALSHYWGGPKLTSSPLAQLNLVRRALATQDGNLTRALRAVLQDAIERQRPGGERKLTASEWLLYNILDLRFVQGQRIQDIARKLSISESDLYRKQRVAVAEVARALAEMEEEVVAGENGSAPERVNGAATEPVSAESDGQETSE